MRSSGLGFEPSDEREQPRSGRPRVVERERTCIDRPTKTGELSIATPDAPAPSQSSWIITGCLPMLFLTLLLFGAGFGIGYVSKSCPACPAPLPSCANLTELMTFETRGNYTDFALVFSADTPQPLLCEFDSSESEELSYSYSYDQPQPQLSLSQAVTPDPRR